MNLTFPNPLASPNLVLLFIGLAILIFGLVISIARVWRSKPHAPRAGWLTVLITLAACVLIGIGVGRMALNGVATTTTNSATNISSNPTPSEAATAASNGNTQQSANAAFAAALPAGVTPEFVVQRLSMVFAAGVSLIILLIGLYLFSVERNRDQFNPSSSVGLLFAGAGVFVIAASLLLPSISTQAVLARANVTATPTDHPLPTRIAMQSATPSVTPEPSETSTTAPTLTLAPDTSPTPLATQIAYAFSDVSNPTGCSTSAKTMMYLRADPSSRQQAIGKVFAGSLLQVIGRSTDQKWVKVYYEDGGIKLEGWVSVEFLEMGLTCDLAALPDVAPTATPSRTPYPTITPIPSRTPRPSATPKS